MIPLGVVRPSQFALSIDQVLDCLSKNMVLIMTTLLSMRIASIKLAVTTSSLVFPSLDADIFHEPYKQWIKKCYPSGREELKLAATASGDWNTINITCTPSLSEYIYERDGPPFEFETSNVSCLRETIMESLSDETGIVPRIGGWKSTDISIHEITMSAKVSFGSSTIGRRVIRKLRNLCVYGELIGDVHQFSYRPNCRRSRYSRPGAFYNLHLSEDELTIDITLNAHELMRAKLHKPDEWPESSNDVFRRYLRCLKWEQAFHNVSDGERGRLPKYLLPTLGMLRSGMNPCVLVSENTVIKHEVSLRYFGIDTSSYKI
jgi:hypothetical protein